MRRGLVLGCGGVLGAAWQVAMLRALEQTLGWDARDADVIIGTSGGAELALCLGAGVSAAELLAAQRGAVGADPRLAAHVMSAPGPFPPLPRPVPVHVPLLAAGLRRRVGLLGLLSGALPAGGGEPAWLARLADTLVPDGGWPAHPRVWMVATDLGSGRRAVFGAPGAARVGVREALLASWAVPGWFPPVKIGGRRYVDGGVVSTASVDLLADPAVAPDLDLVLDEVIVLAPMASEPLALAPGLLGLAEAVMRTQMSRGLAAEVAMLRSAGTRVLCLGADPRDLAVMGPNFMDPARRIATVEHALLSGPDRIASTLRGT